jgi:hypothetical protein
LSLLKKLQNALKPREATGTAGNIYEVPVRCLRCGEVITARVNLLNDLSVDYDTGLYHVRKLVSGSGANRCFQQIELLLTFDQDRQLTDRQISGGACVEEPAEEEDSSQATTSGDGQAA